MIDSLTRSTHISLCSFLLTFQHTHVLLKHSSINTQVPFVHPCSQFEPSRIFLTHTLSVVVMHLLPGLSASPPLAGLPQSLFTLCDTRSLICRTAPSSSAFLLPFPLPLAGVSVKRRSQGADPAQWRRERGGGKCSWTETGWRTN